MNLNRLNSDCFCDCFWMIFSVLLALEVQNFTIFHDIFLNFNLLFYLFGIVFWIVFYQCALVLLAVLCSTLFGLWENRGKWQKLVVKNCYVYKFFTITYLVALDWNFFFSWESKLECYIWPRIPSLILEKKKYGRTVSMFVSRGSCLLGNSAFTS